MEPNKPFKTCPICGKYPKILSRSASDEELIIHYLITCCSYEQETFDLKERSIALWNDYANR